MNAAVHRIGWSNGYASLKCISGDDLSPSVLAECMPLPSGQSIALERIDPSLPLPDFPLLFTGTLVFHKRLLKFPAWHEEDYQIVDCTVEGDPNWRLLNILLCPDCLVESESILHGSPDSGFEIEKYVLNPPGGYSPFFKIWQTSDKEILLDSKAEPDFIQWYKRRKLTGLEFHQVWSAD